MNIPGMKSKAGLLSDFQRDDQERREAAIEMFQVYNGFTTETKALVEAKLKDVNNAPDLDISKKPFVPINITERLINTMAMVYKGRAARQLMVDGSEGKRVPDELFEEIMRDSTVAMVSKQWDAYCRLFNTVLVRPVWRPVPGIPKGGRLDFLIYTPNQVSVVWDPDDYLVPKEVYVYKESYDSNGKTFEEVIGWTKGRHWKITATGEENVGANETDANPYGELPFAVLRLSDTGEFWGDGARDLVDAHLVILALLTLINETGVMQGFEEVFLINLTNRKAGGMDADGRATAHETGPGKRHTITDLDKESVAPQVITYTPELQLDQLSRLIDWELRMIAWRYGLSNDRVAGVVASQRVEKSGVAKLLDNADLEEIREDSLEAYREFEKSLFRVIKKVLDVDARITLPDGEFRIDFEEVAVKVTEGEKRDAREFDLANGLRSAVDLIMEDNPDLDEAEALAKWRKTMQLKREAEDLGTGVQDALRTGDPAQGGGGDGGQSV